MEYLLIAFASTHAAMEAEAYLKPRMKLTVMPVLRSISTGCGISIRIEPRDQGALMEALKDFPLEREMYKLYAIASGGEATPLEA